MILDIVEQDLKLSKGPKLKGNMELCLPHQDNDQIWNGYLSQQETGPDTRKMQMYELGLNSKQIPGL